MDVVRIHPQYIGASTRVQFQFLKKPQLAALKANKQLFYPKLFLDIQAAHPGPKGFYFFGHYPKLIATGERKNVN